jgi:hypothetical protein
MNFFGLILALTYLILNCQCKTANDPTQEDINRLFKDELEKVHGGGGLQSLGVAFEARSSRNMGVLSQSPLADKSKITRGVQTSAGARVIEAASKIGLRVSARLIASNVTASRGSPSQFLARFQAPDSSCPFKANMACNATSRFASFDGSCNNLASPWLGMSETPYKRYEQVTYDDGLNSPRTKSVDGDELPNPRVISRLVFNDNFQFDQVFSHMTAAFGQFIAHDITSVSSSSGIF